ncbi:MAG: Cache 3/Cache 2 fusion domain-containing protein [Peptococcaceae bacterium]|nr:Cache 3/Cache 2 fusion domain-containing protein [Peptococcaceae bacterium]
MKSIKIKLIVLMISVLVLGLGGLSALNYFKTKQILIANLEQSVSSQAKSSAEGIGQWLDTRKAEIYLMAGNPLIVGGKQEEAVPYLTAELQRNKAYEMFFVADGNGDSFNTANSPANISDRDYFKQVMTRGQVTVSNPVISKATGKPIVVVAAPVNRDGVVDGVIGGTVLLDGITQKVSSIMVGKTGYAYMVQGDGTFIAHPEKDLVMKYNPLKDDKADPKLVEAVQKMVAGEKGVARYIFDGVEKYIAFAPVPGTGWFLAVTAPVDELSGQLSSLPVISFITALAFIVVIGIISSIILGGMIGRLKPVVAGAASIAAGDLTVSEIPVRSKDELGQLAGAFNTMLAKLKEITGLLQGKSQVLAASSVELSAMAENVSAGAGETASTISEVAATVDQVAANVQNIAESSARASGFAREGSAGIKRIISQMEAIQKASATSADVIRGLNESSAKISQIVDLITQIAEQTNLLALNAAIEAARAGDQGSGFAVVAEEVRQLAEQSAGAAKEIYDLIATIRQETQQAVRSMGEGVSQVESGSAVVREVGGTLEKIIAAVQGLAGDIQSVAVAGGQISSSIQNIAAAAEEQTATMEEVSSTTQTLAALARELEDLAGRFKVS